MVNLMGKYWKFVFPLVYLVAVGCITFAFPMGILIVAGTLALPWSFLMSFITGPLFALFPHMPSYVGILCMFIPAIGINTFLLFLLEKKLEKK